MFYVTLWKPRHLPLPPQPQANSWRPPQNYPFLLHFCILKFVKKISFELSLIFPWHHYTYVFNSGNFVIEKSVPQLARGVLEPGDTCFIFLKSAEGLIRSCTTDLFSPMYPLCVAVTRTHKCPFLCLLDGDWAAVSVLKYLGGWWLNPFQSTKI